MKVKNCSSCPYIEHMEYGLLQKREARCSKLKRSVKKYAYYPGYSENIPEFCPMMGQVETFQWGAQDGNSKIRDAEWEGSSQQSL